MQCGIAEQRGGMGLPNRAFESRGFAGNHCRLKANFNVNTFSGAT